MELLIELIEKASPYAILAAAAAILIAIVLLVLLIVQNAKIKKLEKRLEHLTEGTDKESLEDVLGRVIDDNRKVITQIKNNVDEIVRINENLLTAYRKIGVVKYNAFPGLAGKVSSSIALLNNENSGIVVSSIHSQDGCYTYVKEIMNGKSINPLTKEDDEALKKALEMQI